MITDVHGNAVLSHQLGIWFQGSHQSTPPFAAQMASEAAAGNLHKNTVLNQLKLL